ncbi:MAG: recombinase RecA [Elusimicrobiota bacterium]|nr:recombinase RecA [Elusimicrobiota bacterium]
MAKNEKQKSLDVALGEIEKKFGKGSIMRLGDEKFFGKVSAIPTRAMSLDIALGIGGIPCGRITEIYGPEGGGKTTLALQIIANVQKAGGTAAFVDAEHAMDPDYAEKIGVNTKELLISQPDSGEQALQIIDTLIRSGSLDIIVLDSVAALVPKAELEGDIGAPTVGLQARLMSQSLRRLASAVSKSRTAAIFINQIREKIGMTFGFGPTTTTPGGRALKFYSSVRLDIRRIGSIKKSNDIIGARVKVKVAKNKVAPPYKVCEFDIYFGKGIVPESSLLDVGCDLGLIKKTGNTFFYGDIKLGIGRENSVEMLIGDQKTSAALEKEIKAICFSEKKKDAKEDDPKDTKKDPKNEADEK